MSRSDYLFVEGNMNAAMEDQLRKVDEAARQIPADHALASSLDELTAELLERFEIEPLKIDWDAKTAGGQGSRRGWRENGR